MMANRIDIAGLTLSTLALTLALAPGCAKHAPSTRSPGGAMAAGGDAMVAADGAAPEEQVRFEDMDSEAEPAPEKRVAAESEQPAPPMNTEEYDAIVENDFIAVADDPLSTFSIDVDTASYSNARRFLREGRLPPADAVRIEEFVNYFEYTYKGPRGSDPFTVASEVGECPWAPTHQLVQVGIQGKKIAADKVPSRNLVFLLDVSGSMNSADKLGLLKHGMSLLAAQLRRQDRVSIVVYAGASGLVLKPTNDKRRVLEALDSLEAGGSTAGAEGIELAYRVAQKTFVKGGINRVILATDGDFNVGPSSQGALVKLIEQKRKTGVFLSVLGFGRGNLADARMEALADHGNGNYAYIDSEREARKVLQEQASATLVTIAKDVKLQVEFNPAQVAKYRLVGYENRKLAHADFNDDKKDAGEIGAGHTVTALYEVVPVGAASAAGKVDPLKYQGRPTTTRAAASGELMTVKIRYKRPDGARSKLLTFPVSDSDKRVAQTSVDFRFAAAVAQFAMVLRSSKHRGKSTYARAFTLAQNALGRDRAGHRREFLTLIQAAARIAGVKLPTRKTSGTLKIAK